MSTHVALLRAVNVGGTGKLPMAELRALCAEIGFTEVRTYIQSGNVIFDSPESAERVAERLAGRLEARARRPVGVLIRSPDELEAALGAHPYPEAEDAQVLVVFVPRPIPPEVLDGWPIPGRERLSAIGREIFIHFPDGMGRSKLKIPWGDVGTGRNLRTVKKLIEMTR